MIFVVLKREKKDTLWLSKSQKKVLVYAAVAGCILMNETHSKRTLKILVSSTKNLNFKFLRIFIKSQTPTVNCTLSVTQD